MSTLGGAGHHPEAQLFIAGGGKHRTLYGGGRHGGGQEKPLIQLGQQTKIGADLPPETRGGQAAGAAVVSTGRSDYPNQINNVLAFPGIFRGAFDVRASDINEEMKVAAAHALAGLISEDELSADYIIPQAFDKRVGPAVAKAVAEAARKTGVARI